MRTCYASMLLAPLLILASALCAHAAPVTPGSILVYRVGDGNSSLLITGNPVFIDEYNSTGTLLQSIPMPTAASSGQNQLIAGTSASEGLFTVSPNGKYAALTGYTADIGGGTALNTANGFGRTVGILNIATGNVDTSTALTDLTPGSNPRSAVTTNGTDIWATGNGGGVRYATLGSTTSTQVLATPSNPRALNTFGGQLYASAGTGIGTIGTGLPTTSQAFTILPGTAPGGSTMDGLLGFFFADLDVGVAGADTLYVAFDDVPALTKYSLVSGTWTSNGTVGVDADNYDSVTGLVSGSTVTLYATKNVASSAGGQLVTLVDASGYNGAFAGTPTTIATAASLTAFRGVAAVPLSTAIPGDFDSDGDVDGADFVAWQTHFPKGSGATLPEGDADNDGDVDGADFVVWQTHFPFTPGPGMTTIPEPSAYLLFVIGVGAILFGHSWRSNKLNVH